MPSDYNLNRYKSVKLWLASESGHKGLARLKGLGATWGPRGLPDEIVEAAAQLEGAPDMPPLSTFRDRASFLAGVCWLLTLVDNRRKYS